MPVPLPVLAGLILGGMAGHSEISKRREANARQAKIDQAPGVAANIVQSILAAQGISLGGPQTQQSVAQSAVPEIMGTVAQTTPEVPLGAEAGVGAPAAQPQPQQVQQPATSQTGQSQIPAILPETHVSAEGEVSYTLKVNEAYFKDQQKRAVLEQVQQEYQTGIEKGLTRQKARTQAVVNAGIKNGMPFDIGVFKEVYPDMSDAQRYNYARSTTLTALADGLSFDRIRNLLPSRYPDITPAQIEQIANDVYYLRKGALYEYAEAKKREEGLQGAELSVESETLSAQWASEDLEQYLPEKERERLREASTVTRVSDISDPDTRDALIDQYGKTSIVRQGQIAATQQMLFERKLSQQAQTASAVTRQTSLAKLSVQMQQIEPTINEISKMALALNTQPPGLLATVGNSLRLWAEGKAETGFGQTVEIDGKMEDVGIIAADYYGTTQSFLGTMARVFSGERGVLTEGDITRIKAALPRLGMSRRLTERRLEKLQIIINDLESRAKAGVPNSKAISVEEANRLLAITQSDVVNGSEHTMKSISDSF